MPANQLRLWFLWFASMAYVLLCALRRIALQGTRPAQTTCGTIRLKLLKIGALVTTSVRRVTIAFASACPDQAMDPHTPHNTDAASPVENATRQGKTIYKRSGARLPGPKAYTQKSPVYLGAGFPSLVSQQLSSFGHSGPKRSFKISSVPH
jgi:hypothetical protein